MGSRLLNIALGGCFILVHGSALAADPQRGAAKPRNVLIFVADGLRSLIVRPDTAPTMAALRDQGVWFKNSHSMYPTFTTPNAASIATGHYIGDHGDFGNTLYAGFAAAAADRSVTPFLENDAVLGEMNEHWKGDYLVERSLFAAARAAGIQTAAIGKLGPVLIQDVTERSGQHTIVIDDSTGRPGGIPLSGALATALQDAGLPAQAPGRGDNGKAGNSTTPGTLTANVEQQKYFVDAATKVVLPRFKAAKKPFLMVFWSRDPDGTQHNQGDSLGKSEPGINGPSSLSAIRNADDNLAALLNALTRLDLDGTTDVLVTADHGFSTISKESKTSAAAAVAYPDVAPGQLPPGFLAIDLARALELPLLDPDAGGAAVDVQGGKHPSKSNGLIGKDPTQPEVIVAANGNSDLIYLPPPHAKHLAPRVVATLLAEDYVGGLFVDDALGHFPGTLPLSSIGLKGVAITPEPAIVVSFTSRSTGCATAVLCAVNVADTGLQQGQGMHGAFSRADTNNFMAARGPDFKTDFVDAAPVSNADVAMTAARLLGVKLGGRGRQAGRAAGEALKNGGAVRFTGNMLRSPPDKQGLRTVLRFQQVGAIRYYDAAGIPGRTVGLEEEPVSTAR